MNSKSQRILRLNRYTWKLLGAIYQNKLDTSLDDPSDTDSHLSAINRLYTRDEEKRHYQVVLDWLESNAAELLPDLPTKVNTVYKVCFELWSVDSPSILIEIISELTSCFVRFKKNHHCNLKLCRLVTSLAKFHGRTLSTRSVIRS